MQEEKIDRGVSAMENETVDASVDTILAKLSEQRSRLNKQKEQLNSTDKDPSQHEPEESAPSSVPLTRATNIVATADTKDGEKTVQIGSVEMLLLKKELDAAKDKIARQEQELSQTRVINHTLDQVKSEPVDQPVAGFPDAFHPSSRLQDDAVSDFSDIPSANGFNRSQNIWNAAPNPGLNHQTPQQASIWSSGSYRPWVSRSIPQGLPPVMISGQQQRTYPGPSSPSSNGNRFAHEYNQFQGSSGFRRPNAHNRVNPSYGPARNNSWESFGVSTDGSSIGGIGTSAAYQPLGMFQGATAYQPRPIGTPLSATAAEFSVANMPGNPWNPVVSQDHQRAQNITKYSSASLCARTNLCRSCGAS